MTDPEAKLIMQKLEEIKGELDEIKEHMIDADTILTPEEERILEESLREYKEGKTITLEEYKRKRG